MIMLELMNNVHVTANAAGNLSPYSFSWYSVVMYIVPFVSELMTKVFGNIVVAGNAAKMAARTRTTEMTAVHSIPCLPICHHAGFQSFHY